MLAIAAVVSLLAQSGAPPQRPPDGTYTYALSQGSAAPIFTSTITVRSNGATFDVAETAKLPNGTPATVVTTWSSATLLPLTYQVRQDAIDLHAAITPGSATLTGPPLTAPLSYTTLAGTKYMLVYEGLNAFRVMLPYVIAAHPGEAFTVAQIDGNQTEQGEPSTSSPPPGGKPGDTGSVITLGKEQIAAWLNPKTNLIDEERATPGDARVTLVQYTPAVGR